jgi:uncharacterized membrane protein
MSAIGNPQVETSNQPLNFASAAPRSAHALAARAGLVAAMGIACMLRLHCLYFRYLFLDECGTIWAIAGGSYKEMLDRSLHWTASGPLFVLCYRLSCDLVGDVVLGVKLPGIVCGTLSVWAVWWSARKLFEREDVAQLAAWFVAIAPVFVAFSQEARPYMPGALLVTLSVGFLASWLRTGRRFELAGTVLFAVLAVGFHLLAALLLVAQNVAVIHHGTVNRWARRRWVEWLLAQVVAACALSCVGIQFRMLSGRHSSLIFETDLPMQTRRCLDLDLVYELRTEMGVVLIALAIVWIARKFPAGWVAKACSTDRTAISTAVSSYVVPAVLISLLSALRVVDCWARYYFLFQPGLIIALAWVVTRPLPRLTARWFAAAIGVAMLYQYQSVGGVPACRLNTSWQDSADAESHLRRVIGPDDLVISRAGLIEANQIRFLSDSVGVSYLRCFLESTEGPLPGEHVPLPFSLENESTALYSERLVREKLANRSDFWLVNVAPNDFDYRAWLEERLGGQFRKDKEYHYSAYVLCRYVRDPEGELAERPQKKGTSDWVPATVSKVPCQRSMLE